METTVADMVALLQEDKEKLVSEVKEMSGKINDLVGINDKAVAKAVKLKKVRIQKFKFHVMLSCYELLISARMTFIY